MLIFVSSVGRSGTRYLAQLFDKCTDVPACHAAEPHCYDQVMIDVNNGIEREEITEKAKIIQGTLSEHGAYLEATQLFTRVLAETFLDIFPAISVIHLLRDPMEVARSYVNRKSCPSRNDMPWRLPLNLKHALFEFPLPLTPFQENLCDWLENELRYLELLPRFTNVTDFYFSNFGNAERICELFQQLDVPYREADVVFHTEKRDLDRNANWRKTRISRRNKKEAGQLLEILRDCGFPGSLFQKPCYEEFEFTRQVAEL
jgi:hypothetical protein